MTLRVAIIGASFARDAYLPAFQQVADAEVVAIASARLESAQSVAEKFSIPHAYDDWRAMLDTHEVDIVGVVTPPVYHAEMTLAAVERGAHVICEKPMSMNADESRRMLDAAESKGRLHIMGHELRFNPNRRKVRQLIADGAIGEIRHVNVVNINGGGDPKNRPAWHWWAMENMGGGVLGANGSHQIDLLRFWLGDIAEISGHVGTMVKNRIGKDTGEPWTPTADDQFNFTAVMTSGALVSVFASSAARHTYGNHVQIYGSEGTIMLANSDEKLLLARPGEDFQDISETDPNATLPGVGKGIWNVSFVALVREFTDAAREGRKLNWGATFADGLKTQQAMDAIKQSWAERRWVRLDS
jgi:predicted dehydrogenase